MPPVFQLKDVSVAFNKQAITHRSLKSTLGNFFNGDSSDKFFALRNINLTIADGENIGIIGRNGMGKSTLLRVLTRVISPQSGKVFVDKSRHIVPLLELGIGFQPDLTGRENCFLAGLLMGYSQSEIAGKIDAIIRFSELGDFIDEPVKNYSSGMYARLAFALATDIRPDVLLVDEVFGVGDEFFMRKCIVRMQQLMRAGRTTIFVSHNLDFLVNQCNRLIWLSHGQIVMDGLPEIVAAAYRAGAEREHHTEVQYA
ncbi:MAG: ABC transporter ATP-binding protein [Calditrichia bacterium]|nr:ABC transporter ATP-binding protein [Calditrichota bacterium]MCB0268284.1 ABC transporter ATP-binding protein [Calditrichota bacterium]MCB9070760.1 ABC transporter ATP-binding protein [Calditrichia bacterium]